MLLIYKLTILEQILKTNGYKHKAKEIKALLKNPYHTNSSYNTFMRNYLEFTLLVNEMGEKIGTHKKFDSL